VAKPTNTTSSNRIIEERLDVRIAEIERDVQGDVLTIKSPIMPGIDDVIRKIVETRKKKAKTKKLLVMLETDGGVVEVARRIADTLHHHYKSVEYLIPNFAMSAGTILVMSGDAIHMDYYSVLGPIDPQVRRADTGQWVPGLGYVEKFDALMKKAAAGGLNTAETTYLVEKFDPAFLHWIEQERDLSITLLKEWLVRYKFKDWKVTQSRRLKVTKKMKEKRAEDIAKILNDTHLWHSHGRGIPMGVVQRTLKLKVEDFGKSPALNDHIHAYYNLLNDYMARRGHGVTFHRHGQYVGFDG